MFGEKFSLNGILNSVSRTLNVIDNAIPLYEKAKPTYEKVRIIISNFNKEDTSKVDKTNKEENIKEKNPGNNNIVFFQ